MSQYNIESGKHVMFSYGWDIQKIVLQIHHRLTEKNVPVWMDREGGMKDYLTNSMADGIEQAAIVCCFITSKYQSSPYCKKELLYAENQKIPVIPCLMDKDLQWMPTGWLGYTIIDILYLDFRDLSTDMSEANLHAKCDLLISRIKGTLSRSNSSSVLKPLPIEMIEEPMKEKPDYDLDDDEFPI